MTLPIIACALFGHTSSHKERGRVPGPTWIQLGSVPAYVRPLPGQRARGSSDKVGQQQSRQPGLWDRFWDPASRG